MEGDYVTMIGATKSRHLTVDKKNVRIEDFRNHISERKKTKR